MDNRSKRKVAGSHASLARKPSAPSYTFICRGTIMKQNGKDVVDYEAKFFDIKLPCNLAELAIEAANAAFSICESLAFKAGIQFLPAKEIKIDGQTGEEIPF